MFAPSPIRIRYGNDGLLGQAAAQVGESAAHDRDLSFLSREMDRRARSYEFAQNNELESRKLQLAHEQSLAQQQPQQQYNYGSPFTQAVATAKQAALAKSSGAVSDAAQPLLSAMASDPSVDAPQFASLLNHELEKTSTQKRQAEQDAQKKANAQTILPRTKFAYTMQGLDNQMRDLRQSMQQIRTRLAKQGINPENAPASLNPEVSTPEFSDSFFGRVGAALLPGTNQPEVTGGAPPETREAYQIYHRLKHELDQLQAQRDTAGGGTQPQQQQITPQIAAQFLAQAGGDKNAARQMALHAGYSF